MDFKGQPSSTSALLRVLCAYAESQKKTEDWTEIGSLEKGTTRLGEILITAVFGRERFHLLSHIDAKEIRSDVAIVQTVLIFVQINQLLQILFFLFDIIDQHT